MKKLMCVGMLAVLCLAACKEEHKEADTKPTEQPKQEATAMPETTTAPEKKPELTGISVEVEKENRPLQLLQATEWLQEWDDDGRLICSVSWQKLSLSEEDAVRYPELEKTLQQRNSDSKTAGEAGFAELLPTAKELLQDAEFEWNCVDESTMYVQRADEHILSVRTEVCFDAGSIHPMTGTVCLNLNPTTGEELVLSSVVKDVSKTIDIVKQRLEADYKEWLFEEWQDMLATYDETSYVWTMDDEGITFYFSPYELAPWAAGLLTVRLDFEELPELFLEEFTGAWSDGFVRAIPFGSIIELKKDGETEYFTLHRTQVSEEDDHRELWLLYNGRRVMTQEIYAYDYTAYLVSPDGERHYLYVEASRENDACSLYVIDLNGAGAGTVLAELGGGFSMAYDAAGSTMTQVFTDRAEFALAFRMDMMRTNIGTKVFHVDEVTGVPVADTEYFKLDSEQVPLVVRQPVEVTMLPEETTEVLDVGTKLSFLRTDNVTYIEFMLPDGRVCRVAVDTTEWPHTVNGVPEEACFEGIGYAG